MPHPLYPLTRYYFKIIENFRKRAKYEFQKQKEMQYDMKNSGPELHGRLGTTMNS